jgi:hypothetical protein
MSDIIRVRDHSRPCEHGSLWPHWAEVRTAKWWQEPDCLGGREMVLRRLGEGVWEEVDEESRLQA